MYVDRPCGMLTTCVLYAMHILARVSCMCSFSYPLIPTHIHTCINAHIHINKRMRTRIPPHRLRICVWQKTDFTISTSALSSLERDSLMWPLGYFYTKLEHN